MQPRTRVERRLLEHESRGIDVTVMVTTYDGADRIGVCLDSLASQTLAPERFEVLVVQNGPPCATPTVVSEFARAHPRLQVRLIELSQGGLGHARNVGLGAARGAYVTYVDDDDWITPPFLEVLLRHAADGIVPVALVSARHDDGTPPTGSLDFDNYASRRLLPYAGRTVSSDLLAAAISYNAGKLLPTRIARSLRYDESLRSGEDFVYWLEVLNRHPFRLHVVGVPEEAAYCRSLRDGSLGRQSADYEFLVTQRLECLAALERIETIDPVASRVANQMRVGQAEWINRYLRERPDEHHRVVLDARARGLATVPWRSVNRGLGRDLTVQSVESRHLDTSALLSAVRLRSRSVSLGRDRRRRRGVPGPGSVRDRVAEEFVDRRRLLDSPRVGPWTTMSRLAVQVEEQVTTWEADKGPYRRVHSGPTALATHVAAALLKVRRPELVWVADLSDPDAFRLERRCDSAVPDDAFSRELRGALHERGVELPDCGISEFVQLVTFALADQVTCAEREGVEAMLDDCRDAALADRVRLLSQVEEHLTLSSDCLAAVESSYDVPDDGVVHIGCLAPWRTDRQVEKLMDDRTPAGPPRSPTDPRARVHTELGAAAPRRHPCRSQRRVRAASTGPDARVPLAGGPARRRTPQRGRGGTPARHLPRTGRSLGGAGRRRCRTRRGLRALLAQIGGACVTVLMSRDEDVRRRAPCGRTSWSSTAPVPKRSSWHPSCARCAPTRLRTQVVVTGQHREMLDQVNAFFGITPDVDLDLMSHGASLNALARAVLGELERVLDGRATGSGGGAGRHHERVRRVVRRVPGRRRSCTWRPACAPGTSARRSPRRPTAGSPPSSPTCTSHPPTRRAATSSSRRSTRRRSWSPATP